MAINFFHPAFLLDPKGTTIFAVSAVKTGVGLNAELRLVIGGNIVPYLSKVIIHAHQTDIDTHRARLPVVKNTPVLAGVNGTDHFKDMRYFLSKIKEIGYSGVQNFPTVGLFEGHMRQTFEETGMSYNLEVDMIRIAHEMDLLTTPYVFNTEEAKKMTDAGADVIVAHCGCTIGGSIGAETVPPLDEAVEFVQKIRDVVVAHNPEAIVMCHGGPISGPEDAEYILRNTTGVHGFYGASSAERLPVEIAIRNHIRKFKSITF